MTNVILVKTFVKILLKSFVGVTSPTSSSTNGGFGQPPFFKDCKPDHLEPSGYSDKSHLIFEKKFGL